MKLALRNRIAEWLLEAIAPDRRTPAFEALAAFADRADGDGIARGLAEADARTLETSGLFVPSADGVRLRDDLAGDLPALRDRVGRFAAAVRSVAAAALPPNGPERAVAAARILFEHRLFFEVHEILEPPWREAEGDAREILQGLIQVAVGFHHHESGNLRGAISLLAEGNAKLFAHVPEAFDVDLAALCSDVEAFSTSLRHVAADDAAASLPPTPRWRRP